MMEENKERNIVWKPQPRQLEFMRRPEPEALYCGAAGGGKSDALVIEALRQVHIPHYRALILRKTYPQLSDLVDKSQRYYLRAFPEAQYNATSHVWVFPSGAKIYFGSLNHAQDKYNYQGKAFDFIGVDELTHFTWDEYSYVMSRNREMEYVIENGKDGWMCATKEEWVSALESLVTDEKARKAMGEAAHEKVMEHYLTENTGKDAMEELLCSESYTK